MKIALDHEKLQYSGRIDDRNPKRPEFIFPASSLEFRFRGTGAVLTVSNHRGCWNNYLGIIVDGEQRKELLPEQGSARIVLAEGLEDTEHQILVFKRQDSCHTFAAEELEVFGEGTLLELPEKPHRKIEVYGDSVSAGEVSEAVDYAGRPDPEHNGEYSNSWYSYSWMTARKLNAQIHDIAQGGIALLEETGWFCAPHYVGMERVWDKVHYNPELGETTDWDFSRYTPHVVIVAIGQNDSHPDDYMKEDPDGERAEYWREHYRSWIRQIRGRYPEALIILTTTILNHDVNWDRSIDQVCRELKDEKIVHFLYSNNGAGTPGHIRIPEAERMAEELSSFIESMPDSIWK
ncbi:MAG: GDSL-type esterase/lipase family protein [Eubacteriales bacterium]|nr:GDSL-type esterase/lipase family protein [Eubacteriales bacterium]